MARAQNFLLGQGERLATRVKVPKGGDRKKPPYDFRTARERLGKAIERADVAIARLPDDACPQGESVAVVTLHPRYVAKSDFPSALFKAVGVRPIGTRSRRVTPESWGLKEARGEALTEEVYVAGSRSAFHRWAETTPTWAPKSKGADDFSHIEDVRAVSAKDKLRSIPKGKRVLLEVVLHNSGSDNIVLDFLEYAKRHGAEPLIAKRRDVQGLTFVPVWVSHQQAEDIARFSFVRVARGMPTLRPFPAPPTRSTGSRVTLPTNGPLDRSIRAVIFDGGIPASARKPLEPWVTLHETNVGPPVSTLEAHGLAVTTAFVFGHIESGGNPGTPLCHTDHVRVLDQSTAASKDVEYFDVLDRILSHLDRNPRLYALVNISLGPNLPVDDDDVTLWTAEIDKRFAHGRCIATVAAGNDGELDAASGLNRIQPPADGVNVLSVGAADRVGVPWQRAPYSCTGPGRCPGVVKPDGVAFGGCQQEPFGVLTDRLRVVGVEGTSFAAPLALRSAASVVAQLGTHLSPLAVRALMIHRAQLSDGHDWREVGWGRFEADPNRLITCDDDEALVVFQGDLPVGEHLRTPIPLRDISLIGDITLTATLVIAPEVDPEHASAYTRSGLEVSFRPHASRHAKSKNGKDPEHAKTRPFFSETLIYGGQENLFRGDGHKWEPCLKREQKFRATSLSNPCFDIYYHHRDSARAAGDPKPISYAFVVGVRAPKVRDLYSSVVRAYANVLIPIRPRLRLQVRT